MNALRLAQRTAVVFLLALLFFSCTKEPNLIGLDLVPPGDLLKMGYTDTLQIDAFSVREDSVYSANGDYAIIGSMYDPIFGLTTADWFGQIRLSTEPTNFGINPIYDSAFLYMSYNHAYGDTLSNMTIRVYPLEENLLDSVQQYSNHTVDYDINTLLGELTFTPRPSDSAYYDGGKQAPSLRIPLNAAFAQQILSVDTSVLATNVKFINFFKGIAIIAEQQQTPGKGAILYMNTSSTISSEIVTYYHNSTDTSSYHFLINTSSQRFNHFEHNGYAEAAPLLKQQIIAKDSSLGNQFLFLQGMGGVKVKLKFPTIKNLVANQKVLINDAQLILENASPSGVFTPPSYLALYPISDDGSPYVYGPPDAGSNNTTYVNYDGYYNTGTGAYRFRLTRYFQQLMDGKLSASVTANGLYLMIPTSSYNSSRLTLNGTSSPAANLKLYLKYTVVK